jgi:hypothetical protein
MGDLPKGIYNYKISMNGNWLQTAKILEISLFSSLKEVIRFFF